ncbi:hypothetical protein B0T25DRAFT_540610 [Lasiosphaeria hispida]|uniref:Uncharacterized protein n=1 Tax=Lasiosphaeria hispida TaxID=260671 RepID=A0AAJ0HN43_9PEZI|nr:hypothetical protein B0T25DRAFT_540610 [Lasiosphaeria hispida]
MLSSLFLSNTNHHPLIGSYLFQLIVFLSSSSTKRKKSRRTPTSFSTYATTSHQWPRHLQECHVCDPGPHLLAFLLWDYYDQLSRLARDFGIGAIREATKIICASHNRPIGSVRLAGRDDGVRLVGSQRRFLDLTEDVTWAEIGREVRYFKSINKLISVHIEVGEIFASRPHAFPPALPRAMNLPVRSPVIEPIDLTRDGDDEPNAAAVAPRTHATALQPAPGLGHAAKDSLLPTATTASTTVPDRSSPGSDARRTREAVSAEGLMVDPIDPAPA